MITMPVNTWAEFKALMTTKLLQIQYYETNLNYEIFASEAGVFVWNISLLKDGGADVLDFEANFKSNANKQQIMVSQVLSLPAFGAKTIVAAGVVKKLFARYIGIQQALTTGVNEIIYTATFPWSKMIGIEVVNSEALDAADLKVYDTPSGIYSGVPDKLLNQFSFSNNIPKDYYVRMAQFDADLYQGMVLKVTYTSVGNKTVGINLILNEVTS